MFAEFETYITNAASLSGEELQLMRSHSIERVLERKELLLQEGEVCRYKAFISKGILRTYRTKDDGSEHILQFSPENNWAIDPESYDNIVPSSYNIDALENSELILWAKNDFDELLQKIPRLKYFAERLISANIYLGRERIYTSISATAEEKYDEFIRLNPGVFARVPLHMVAAYLGVTRETLSRIRHAQVKR